MNSHGEKQVGQEDIRLERLWIRSSTLPEVGGMAHVDQYFPPWKSVSGYFRPWKKSGLWPKIDEKLGQEVGEASARQKEARASMIDSQAVKTTEKGGPKAMMPAKNKG